MENERGMKGRVLKLFITAFLLVMLCGMNVLAADRTVSMKYENGGYTYVGQLGSAGAVYHKITVKKTSTLLVTGSYTNGYYSKGMRVALCNSKKKSLEVSSKGSAVNLANYNADTFNGLACYGVKKGTYYIKVTGVPANDTYMLIVYPQACTDKGGSTKAKAATISHNKAMLGVMCAGESASKADWYKFKVTKKKVLNLYYETAGTGKFTLYLYGPSFKNGIKVDSLMNASGSYYSKRGSSKLKVATGTYYLKVVRASGSYKKACGVYELKWKLS